MAGIDLDADLGETVDGAPAAVDMARAVRAALVHAGLEVRAPW